MSDLKQQFAEQEMKKIAEERRRDKLEAQKAKEKIRAQIEQDRKDRKEREAREGQPASSAPIHLANSSIPVVVSSKEYNETRLQIRQLDGKPIIHTFSVKEPLSAVRLYVQLNRKDKPGVSPNLMTNF